LPRFRPETETAINAVERALDHVRSRVGAEELTLKGARDVVTATDLTVEDEIRTLVGDALHIPVVGEERAGEMPAGTASYWLVDPICGTRNFASGIPLYCVNLALVEDDRVTVAIVGDPSNGEVHVAEADRGAWSPKDGSTRRLRTSPESQTIVIEDSHAIGARREQAARFVAGAIQSNQWDIRALSTTLSLAYVAAGRVAAYVLFWTSAIHAAAGSLLAAEAGATVSDVEGRPWTIHSDSIVASATPALHSNLLQLVRSAF
jgi:myo-inositol-1(or 4)-monophosphatase